MYEEPGLEAKENRRQPCCCRSCCHSCVRYVVASVNETSPSKKGSVNGPALTLPVKNREPFHRRGGWHDVTVADGAGSHDGPVEARDETGSFSSHENNSACQHWQKAGAVKLITVTVRCKKRACWRAYRDCAPVAWVKRGVCETYSTMQYPRVSRSGWHCHPGNKSSCRSQHPRNHGRTHTVKQYALSLHPL